MKKLSNTKAELKKALLIKKCVYTESEMEKRSSRTQMLFKLGVPKNFAIHRKTPVL